MTSILGSKCPNEHDDVLKSSMSCRLQITPMVLVEQEQKGQTEGTGVVPAKNPPNVKSLNKKFLKTL